METIPSRFIRVPAASGALLVFTLFAVGTSRSAEHEKFVPLFDGKSWEGWVGDTQGYEVTDEGTIRSKPESGGNIFTKKEFADFVFRFEFKLTPGANNGVGLRAPLEGDAAYGGMESQILDNDAERYANLQPYQYHGSIYGVLPAKRGHLRPTGEWNEEEIICLGRHVRVKLNGVVIVDGNLDQASTPETIDHRPHPGLKRESGHLGFLGHGAEVEFRNLRILEL